VLVEQRDAHGHGRDQRGPDPQAHKGRIGTGLVGARQPLLGAPVRGGDAGVVICIAQPERAGLAPFSLVCVTDGGYGGLVAENEDSGTDTGTGPDALLSREHVEHILHRVGLAREQIEAVLDDIKFPSTLTEIRQKAMEHGIYTSTLTDRMGGSP
jgi:hypothetical protein